MQGFYYAMIQVYFMNTQLQVTFKSLYTYYSNNNLAIKNKTNKFQLPLYVFLLLGVLLQQ